MRRLIVTFGLLMSCMCVSSASAALVSYNSAVPDQNAAARNGWLTAAGIIAPRYRVDFETDFSDGQNVSRQAGLFPGRLLIRDTSIRNQAIVRSGPGTISLSNPIGKSALSWEGNLFEYLELDFSGAPVDYVSWQDIDTTSNNSLISIYYTDGTYTNFRPDDTYTTGDSAEFLGFYRNDLAQIRRVRLNLSGDMYGIDNIEYGNLPSAAPLAGDFDESGIVDAGDYVTWRRNAESEALLGSGATLTMAQDYDLWRRHFGDVQVSSGESQAANLVAIVVPEPLSCILMLVGASGLIMTLRRKR
jgi:hypothetical protein